MPRFRLRFLLQEFDLPVGEVVIGRSPECFITIEDALISRRHSRIVVTDEEAVFHDLGSRNGSRINGQFVSAPTSLQDADRIRLGAQELVVYRVGAERRAARQTGAMLFCRRCATPYPEGAQVCPHCGSPAGPMQGDDETMSGIVLDHPRRTWMLQLMGEVLDRALTSRRVSEAERILERAADEFKERVDAGDMADSRQLAQIADYAVRLALLQGDPEWIRWVTEMYLKLERLPSGATIDRLAAARVLPGVPAMIRAILAQWTDHQATLSSDEIVSLGRLDALVQSMDGS